jgi:DNA-binding transcriptional LysR family regulator
MQTDYLKCFIDAADLGSITAAANRHFITPQGMSRIIGVLEKDVGCKLTTHSRKQFELTAAGKIFYDYCKKAVSDERRLQDDLTAAITAESETIHNKGVAYCSAPVFDTPLFYPIVDEARGYFNTIRFIQQPEDVLVERLIRDDAAEKDSFFFGIMPFFDNMPEEKEKKLEQLERSDFSYQPIITSFEQVLVPEDSPLAQKKVLTKSDILTMPIAISPFGMSQAITRYLGTSENVYAVAADSMFRMRLVSRGEALSFIPDYGLSYDIYPGITAVPMKDPYTVEIGVAVKKGDLGEQLVLEITDGISDYFETHRVSSKYTHVIRRDK